MYTTQIDLGSTYYLELFVTDAHGDPVSGLSVTYVIYDSSDESLVDSSSLIDEGNGIYKASRVFSTSGQFRIIYTTPTNYSDEIEVVLVKEAAASDAVLRRILGLTQENYRITNQTYDKNNNLIGGTISIYPSATDLDNNTNVLATYQMSAVFNLKSNHLTDYKVKRIS